MSRLTHLDDDGSAHMVDVSAKPGNQQLVTLHERRGTAGETELVATFYSPGTVADVSRTIEKYSPCFRAATSERANGP